MAIPADTSFISRCEDYMLFRITLCLLSIYACSTDKKLGYDNKRRVCPNTCDEACGDWGEWSAWSPATDTVCEREEFKQQRYRERTRLRDPMCLCVDGCEVTRTEAGRPLYGTKKCSFGGGGDDG